MLFRQFAWFFVGTALASASLAAEAGSEVMEVLDRHLAAARAFEDGQDGNPLLEIERVVFAMPPDAKLRDAVEQKLIDALQSASTDAGKRFLCTQLRVAGTQKCIPCLERLLLEDSVSHMAVYALGNLESPAACEALHRAMLKTGQLAQVGIINALADRGYEQAGPDIAALVASEDVRVASAAVRALGRLGGADAVNRLQAARAGGSPALAGDIDNSLLNCAERFLAGGKATEAADIYALLEQSPRDSQLKLAALRGLLFSRKEQAAGQLVQSIQAADAEQARGAISFLNLVPGHEVTKAVVRLLPSLPDARQVLLLRALGERRDVTASPAIVAALGSGDMEVRVAALEALAGAGDASSLPALLQAAAAEGPGQPVARASLVLLNAADIDRELLRLVDAGDPAGRVEAIRALAGRGVADAVVPLLKLARTDNASIRRAAIETLGMLAGEAHLEQLLQLAIEPIDAADQPVIIAAVGHVYPRIEDESRRAASTLRALDTAPATTKPVLLQLLAKTGSENALGALRERLADPDPAIRHAAVRALADWPDSRASDDLLSLIRSTRETELKTAALNGYLRIAQLSDDPAGMYVRVLERVQQPSDKRMVLERLGTAADSPAAIDLALSYLADKSLAPTAGLAVTRIAYRLRNSHADVARKALRRVVSEVEHEDVPNRAREVLNELDKYEGHIFQWVGVGPFTIKGKTGEDVYRTAFPPETEETGKVAWKPVTKGFGSWEINLEAEFGGADHCAAYVRTSVWSPVDQEAMLELGSDDAIKAWVNNEVVFDQWAVHGAEPRQVRVTVKLAKGPNRLMLKVVDYEGGWVFGCRLRTPQGAALDGLQVKAE